MPRATVRPPWATIDDSSLGVQPFSTSAEAAQKEKYLVQAPWTKKGSDKLEETAQIREALEVRRVRRAENAQREKALRDLSSNDNEETRKRNQEFRTQRAAQQKEAVEESFHCRENNLTAAVENQRGFVAERRAREAADRERAAREAREAIERKKLLRASERSAAAENRAAISQEVAESTRRTAALQGQRRLEQNAYKKELQQDHASRARVRAEKIHQERIERETREKQILQDAKERKYVHAVWTSEEKHEQKAHAEEKMQEKKSVSENRMRAAYDARIERQEAAERVASDFQNIRHSTAQIKNQSRKEKEEEARTKREMIEHHMELRHMKAVERKQAEQQAFIDRNVKPLERRSEMNRARNAQQKKDAREFQQAIEKDVSERRKRLGEINKQAQKLEKMPLTLG